MSMEERQSGALEVPELEPDQIVERATGKGRERLDRSALDIFLTGVIGGAEVSIGGLAAMLVVGASLDAFPNLHLYGALALGGLAFPVGFLLVILGRSELFTENFLIPVVAVLTRQRSLGSLVQMWGLAWLGNMAGCAFFALLVSVPDAIGEPIHRGYVAYSSYKLPLPLPGLFVSAVLAGAVMTTLTWVLLAVPIPLGKMVLIFAAGYVLFAANLSHSIVGAAVLLVGYAGAGYTLLDTIRWLLIATAGNLVGGVGLVTLFRIVQAHEKRRQRAQE